MRNCPFTGDQVICLGRDQAAESGPTTVACPYADDTSEMRKRRLRHLNLGGPAGFVSMEDGCVGGFVERGIATADNESGSVLCLSINSRAL